MTPEERARRTAHGELKKRSRPSGKLREMLASATPPGGTCTGWPMESIAMGVHPEQTQEANEHLAASGISSREAIYKPDGKLEIQSAKARKKVLKSKGMIDLEDANTKH